MDPKNDIGSNVAPVEDGNTKSSTGGKKQRDSGKKHWILTIHSNSKWNGSNGSNLLKWIKTHCEKAVWQIEEGDETHRVHVQISLTLKVKNRLSWLKNHMMKAAHCESIRNHDAAFDYTQKSKTRIDGPFYWPEQVEEGVPDPLEGLEYYPWQQEIMDILDDKLDPRKIYWYWEPVGNVGKSDFCLHLILTKNAVVYDGCKKDILHAHNKAKIVIFDFDRDKEGMVSYSAMESLKKGFCFSGKYESGMKIYPKPYMIVFANWPPDTTRLSADRWVVKQIV